MASAANPATGDSSTTWQIPLFFQAEGGIRDIGMTGVQTCALPILFIGAAISTVLLARNYRQPGNVAEFYSFLILSTIGLNLMAGAGEMITAYLSLELASISLYIMCGYFKSELRSSEAGIKYYVFGVLSPAVLVDGLDRKSTRLNFSHAHISH